MNMAIDVSASAWHNGAIVPRERASPSIASISLHMGTGVFDGVMAYWNDDHFYLHAAREHFERFRRNATSMGLAFPWSSAELEAGARALLAEHPGRTTYLRPLAFRAAPQLFLTGTEHLPVDVSMFGVTVARDNDTSLRCQLSPIERVSGRAMPVAAKACGLYVNSYACRRAAERDGFDDGIMLDRDGRITEASAANVVFLQDRGVVTPRVTPDIFPGITRALVLQIASELGLDVTERDVRAEELGGFDGAFLCATLMELRPLACISDMAFDTALSDVYRALVGRFRQFTHR